MATTARQKVVFSLFFALVTACAPNLKENVTTVHALSASEPVRASSDVTNQCDEYDALEAGQGDGWQDWFNHLDAPGYARFRMSCLWDWGEDQFYSMDHIVQVEAPGWNHLAVNRSSGACGIGQAYHCDKMAPWGADYRTNPRVQVRWMLDYMRSNYGDANNAWRHRQRGTY